MYDVEHLQHFKGKFLHVIIHLLPVTYKVRDITNLNDIFNHERSAL